MRKTKLTIVPSYKGKGYRLLSKKDVKVESLPQFIEEIIFHWIRHYNEMIEDLDAPFNLERFFLLGKKIAEELEEYLPELEVTYASLQEIKSQIGEDLLYQVKLNESLGQDYETIHYLKRRVMLDENNIDYLFDLGLKLINNQKYDDAATYFTKAFDIKNNSDIAFLLGICLLTMKEHRAAKRYYEYALTQGNVSPELIISAGLNYTKLEEYQTAINLLLDGLKNYPSNYEMIRDLAMNYHHKSEYESEIKMLQRLIELKPYEKDHFAALGNSFLFLGNLHEAIKAFKQVLKLDPDYGLCYFRIAQLYHSLQLENFAIDWYLKALLKNPHFAKQFWEENEFISELLIEPDLKKELILFGAKSGDKGAQAFLAKENQSYVWD